MRSTKTNPNAHCKHCMCKVDAATSIGDETPEPGDISICYKCATVGVFDDDMNITPFTDDELLELMRDAPDTYAEVMIICNFLKQRAELN